MRVYWLHERSRPLVFTQDRPLGQCGSAPDAHQGTKVRAKPFRSPQQRGGPSYRRGQRRLAKTAHAPRCGRLSRLLHPARQPVSSIRLRWVLGRTFCCTKCCRESSQRFRCGGAGRRGVVRQKLRGLWRYHPRCARLRHLVGRGLSFRRYGFRDLLCYLPDMPAVLRALASAENSIERWGSSSKQHFEQTEKDLRFRSTLPSYWG